MYSNNDNDEKYLNVDQDARDTTVLREIKKLSQGHEISLVICCRISQQARFGSRTLHLSWRGIKKKLELHTNFKKYGWLEPTSVNATVKFARAKKIIKYIKSQTAIQANTAVWQLDEMVCLQQVKSEGPHFIKCTIWVY